MMPNRKTRREILERLTRFSSFKAGILTVLICVAAFAWCSNRGGKLHRFVKSLDNRVTDLMFRVRGPEPTTGSVVIVDFDEKSLAEVGQWPWPRDVIGQLLLKLGQDDPKIIGLDIVFPEPDRMSPARAVPRLEKVTGTKIDLPADVADNDVILGNAAAETPTVLGYVFVMKQGAEGDPEQAPPPNPQPPCPQFSIVLDEEDIEKLRGHRVPEALFPILNVPAIADGGLSEGYFNALLDVTGMVRRVPLFALYQGVLYPALSLEMLREGLGVPTANLTVDDKGISNVTVGDRVLPTDRDGQMCINFRGRQRTFDYFSATDILNGRLPPGTFTDKYILIGTSAAGLLDLRSTPFDEAYPGVEVHANMIDNALAGDAMNNEVWTEKGVILSLIVGGGLILTALLAYGSPVAGGIGGLLLIVLVCVGNYAIFFRRNQLVGVTYSFVALLVVYLTVTLVNYFLEGREKRIVRGMFQTMVSADVLKYMENNPGSFSLAGEQREATMFFSDVAGFTTISESLTPEGLVQLLNAYLTPMTEIIMGRQGYVDKYEGDAIMAEWGVPFPSTEHAQLACFAALEQQEKLAAMREELYNRFGHRLFVRMGINSGVVSAGNMGSTRRFSYTVMGDAVNQAARFEPANKDYGTDIMMGAATFELAKDYVEARLLDKIIVKGKTEPIMIYELLAKRGQVAAAKAEVAALYVDALKTHWDRRFADAAETLEKALSIDPEDNPCKALSERIRRYIEEPPPPAWQGEYVRASKD